MTTKTIIINPIFEETFTDFMHIHTYFAEIFKSSGRMQYNISTIHFYIAVQTLCVTRQSQTRFYYLIHHYYTRCL